MIIARAPLRITLGGGGTDLPWYYERFDGVCLAAAIDKFVYITVHETFVDDLIVKYSETERVANASEVQHPLVRAALAMLDIDGHGLEICSHADVPAGTGLGSSSSFTVALLYALHAYRRDRTPSNAQIAQEACEIEIDICKQPIGKQDQYMAAYGGINRLYFYGNGQVDTSKIPLSEPALLTLSDNLCLFYTGTTRLTAHILNNERHEETDMHESKALAEQTYEALCFGDLDRFATCLNDQWNAKVHRQGVSERVRLLRKTGIVKAASGCKLVGAGGGGFLLFYADENKYLLRREMHCSGARELPFRLYFEGVRLVVHE